MKRSKRNPALLYVALGAAAAYVFVAISRGRASPTRDIGDSGAPSGLHPGNASWDPLSKYHVLQPDEFGDVQHYALPGTLEGDSSTSGILHVFLKAILDHRNHRLLRGFVTFESAPLNEHSQILHRGPHLTVPCRLARVLDLRLRSRTTNADKQLSLDWATCPFGDKRVNETKQCRDRNEEGSRDCPGPYSVLSVPEFHVDFGTTDVLDWEIAIPDWIPSIKLGYVLKHAKPVRASKHVWKVIKPLFKPEPKLLDVFPKIVEYERLVGLAGTVFYFRDEVLAESEDHAAFNKLVQDGHVIPVRWPYFGTSLDTTKIVWTTYDQEIVNNHAILSFWGTGDLLFIADMDELIALPTEGVTLEQTIEGCMGGRAGLCARLSSVPTYSEGSELERRADADVLGAYPTKEAMRKFSVTKQSTNGWYKSLLNPSRTLSFAVHEGSCCTGEWTPIDPFSNDMPASPCTTFEDETRVEPDCLRFMHVTNLSGRRSDVSNDTMIRDSSWMWILDQA